MLVYLDENDAKVMFKIVDELEAQMDLSKEVKLTCEEDS